MAEQIKVNSGALNAVFEIGDEGKVALLHFSATPFDPEHIERSPHDTAIELHCIGGNINDHHGSKYTRTSPGAEMRYVSHTLAENKHGPVLELVLSDGALKVTQTYTFYNKAGVARCQSEIVNESEKAVTLAYAPSFVYYGLAHGSPQWDRQVSLSVCHNTWVRELQWRTNTLWELGLVKGTAPGVKRLSFDQTGTWSSSAYLPMGVVTQNNQGASLFWQIEHNGSWHAEYGDGDNGALYLQLSGPTDNEHQFREVLEPGESFTTVPVAVGACMGGFGEAVAALTAYRRLIRRPNADNENLPVIFNDYMNCLNAEPTTEKSLPLIEAAAKAGCEYYVVDAGWYTDVMEGGSWWSTIGEWQESKKRFPGGFREVIDSILAHGMKPGLWVEIEGIGKDCPLVSKLPDDWFFSLYGQRVVDHDRFQLDFSNPAVRKFADETIDRLVRDYSIAYFKIDYNINAGIGTDAGGVSPGAGLLRHNRAYLAWLDAVLARHPGLVIENCASGGMRMDYAMLSRLSIQSTSDQGDYRAYASIAAMAPSAVTPEQAAVWSYPNFKTGDEEEAVFNMVNVLLGRIHQSGFLSQLPRPMFDRVAEGIACYKRIRSDIPNAIPVFPLGAVYFDSDWLSGGLLCENRLYVAVWRQGGETDSVTLQLPWLAGKSVKSVQCIYPVGLPCEFRYDAGALWVHLAKAPGARLFQIEF